LRLSNLPMREMITNPIFHGNPYILKMRKPAALAKSRRSAPGEGVKPLLFQQLTVVPAAGPPLEESKSAAS
jgi:hypothetical protein